MGRLLSLFAGVVLLAALVGLGVDLGAGELGRLPAQVAVLVVAGATLVVLFARGPLTMSHLRIIEAIAYGTVTLYLALQTYASLVAELSGPSAAASGWQGVILRFSLLLVAYGLLVPNTPVRAAAGVVLMLLAPLLAAAAVRLLNPELRGAFDSSAAAAAFDTAFWLGLAAAVAVFAAFFTGNLFNFAYDQRRRLYYDLERRIGSGGMGEVWLARHRTLARPTALKLIREDKVAGIERDEAHRLLQRFEREAKATATLRSPHTIDVYDYGVTDDGHFFYAMEYLQGLDLETLVRDHGPIPPERAIHLLMQACDSLADAHEAGFTHRDIKPANLFLGRRGPSNDHLKILDFGLVRRHQPEEGEETVTAEGTASGTPAYMAPESALRTDEVDARTDLYGLGAVAYWLLTGRHVFEADSGVAMIVEHVRTVPTPPSQRTEQAIPRPLDDLVIRCLQKEPADRFASAREMAEALARVPLDHPWTPSRAAAWWDVHLPGVNAA